MKRNPLTPLTQLTQLKKMLQRARRLYKAVLVLSGITAIVLAVLEELRNVEKRRRKPEDLLRDPDVTDREETIKTQEIPEEDVPSGEREETI